MTRRFYSQRFFAISFITAMVMVAAEVSPWISFFSFLMLIWKWFIEKYDWRPLSRKITGVMSIVFLVTVLLQFRTLVGQEPAYTFLLALASLRLMDYQNERDHKFVVLLGLLLIAMKSLFSMDIYWIGPSAFAFAGIWYSLLPKSMMNRRKFLLKVFAYSIPGAALLFVLFPRFVVPWAMSRGGSSIGEVGFADDMNPGKVAELAESPAVAFRAQLVEQNLKNSDLYWRGAVLSVSQGLAWKPGPRLLRLVDDSTQNEDMQDSYSYQVALEPSAQSFLFVLDGTRRIQMDNNSVLEFTQNVFRAGRPISKTTAYRAIWDFTAKDRVKPSEADLKLPKLSEKVLKWVADVKKNHPSEKERLREIQRYFSSNDFIYTLKPGAYGQDGLEEFLFKRKKGFCEHYAGAYATLARAMGVPARVVLGYQGGRYNPLGDFWKISQKDAHAWVEIFSDDLWQRVDPTGWVAPLRLTIGAEEFFNLSEEDQVAFAKNINWRKGSSDISLIDALSHWIEDLNYQWTYFLLDFDNSSQEGVWQKVMNNRGNIFGFFVLVLGIAVLGNMRVFRDKSLYLDERVLIREIDGWGRRHGLPRQASEPPLLYIQRLGQSFPHLDQVLNEIASYYDLKVYANHAKVKASGPELIRKWRLESKRPIPRSA